MRIIVVPERLLYLSRQMFQEAAQLREMERRLGCALGGLDWSVRQQTNVDGWVYDARDRARALAERAENLARFLANRAQAFQQADQEACSDWDAFFAIPRLPIPMLPPWPDWIPEDPMWPIWPTPVQPVWPIPVQPGWPIWPIPVQLRQPLRPIPLPTPMPPSLPGWDLPIWRPFPPALGSVVGGLVGWAADFMSLRDEMVKTTTEGLEVIGGALRETAEGVQNFLSAAFNKVIVPVK